MKARFDTKQNAVTVAQLDGIDFIYICLNESIVTETSEELEGEQTYHEYDYREISEPTGTIDLEDVKANPEKYIDYENEVKTDTERIDTLEATTDDIILMMADLIGGEA